MVNVNALLFEAKVGGMSLPKEKSRNTSSAMSASVAFHAKLVQAMHVVSLAEMTCRIVRVYDNNRAGARSNGPLQSVKINLPAIIVNQWIAYRGHILNIGKKIEKWIARLGN